MAITVVESNTQSATGAHDLGSGSTTSGVFVCRWNLTDMSNGEVIRCYVKVKLLSGDTAEDVYVGYYRDANAGGSPLVQSPPVVSIPPSGSSLVQCGVEEIGANTVSVPWELVQIA